MELIVQVIDDFSPKAVVFYNQPKLCHRDCPSGGVSSSLHINQLLEKKISQLYDVVLTFIFRISTDLKILMKPSLHQ